MKSTSLKSRLIVILLGIVLGYLAQFIFPKEKQELPVSPTSALQEATTLLKG